MAINAPDSCSPEAAGRIQYYDQGQGSEVHDTGTGVAIGVDAYVRVYSQVIQERPGVSEAHPCHIPNLQANCKARDVVHGVLPAGKYHEGGNEAAEHAVATQEVKHFEVVDRCLGHVLLLSGDDEV